MRLIAVGTRMPAWVSAGCDEYLRRLRPALRVDIVELAPGPRSAGTPVERAMEDEARRQLGRLAKDEYVVALDERGKMLDSLKLAQMIQQCANDSIKNLVFLVGGAYGMHPDVLQRAQFKWSLSALTFPHQLVRLILAEQLYRACTINKNEKYHHK
mgnify:CR=1 FL=1